MSDDRTTPRPADEHNQLIEEASTWCYRMHGPDADQHREGFEKWLALGAVHRQIYSEVCELFGYGEKLRALEIRRDADPDDATPPSLVNPKRRRPRSLMPLLAAGFVGLAALAGLHTFGLTERTLIGAPPLSSKAAPLQLQTALGEKRVFPLQDGSIVTLDTDSLVTVAFDHERRELRLEQGRARFEVKHERRPFVVDAGAGSIVAHGTVFDVSIASDRTVHVHLYRGAIDVRSLATGTGGRQLVTKLVSGESVAYAADPDPLPVSSRQDVVAPDWPSGLIPFDRTPLAQVVEQANRYSAVKILLADPALGARLVSGTLRIDNVHTLAQALARELQLRVTKTKNGILLAAP